MTPWSLVYLSGAALTAYNAALAVIAAYNAAIQSNTNREPGAIDEHTIDAVDLGGDGWYDPLSAAPSGFTLQLYVDDQLVATLTVNSQTPGRFPAVPAGSNLTYRGKQFSVRMSGILRVHSLAIGTSIQALKELGA